MSHPPLILDASVVFNLGHRGGLVSIWEKMAALRELIVTPEVCREVTLKPRTDIDYPRLLAQLCRTWTESLGQITAIPDAFQSVLGAGEQSVLALAIEQNWEVAIDERVARKAAKEMNLRVWGTLGLVEQALQLQWLPAGECMDAVWRMHDGGFFLPVKPAVNEAFGDYLERVNTRVSGS